MPTPDKTKTQYKSFDFEIKEVTDLGVVVGYAAVFDNIDLGDDVIEKGAFKRTIKSTKGVWPVLANHDPRVKIGFNLSAAEDDHGLLIKEQLALDVQTGREQFALTKLAHAVGGKDGFSIGYSAVNAVPDKERPAVRRLKEVKMYEHSHVTFGMNELALSTAAKAWKIEDPEADLGEYTDLFFKHMEFLGFDLKEVTAALRSRELATKSADPGQLIHSLDKAINVLKGA